MRKALSILLICLASCHTSDEKKQLLPNEKMKQVIWQLMQVDEYYTRKSITDSTWRIQKKNLALYQQVFDLNKIDRKQFYTTVDYLERHPIEFKVLMDSVGEVSKREKSVTIKPK
jgi:hypothetical protein